MSRLCPGINANFAVYDVGSETVDVADRNAFVAPLPSLPAVCARVDRTEKCAGEHRPGCALKDDRADILTAQGALSFAPFPIVFTFELNQSVLRADPELPRSFV